MRITHVLTTAAVLLASAGCETGRIGEIDFWGSGPVLGNGPAPVTTIISGADQTAHLDTELPNPIIVRLDSAGKPLAGGRIRFTITYSVSPGPNWTWEAVTGPDGTVATNVNVSPGPAGGPRTYITGSWTIVATHRRCVDSVAGFDCVDGAHASIAGMTIP